MSCEILRLSRKGASVTIESQAYAVLQYMDPICRIVTVHGTLRCVCLRCSADDEVEHTCHEKQPFWSK